MRRETNVLPTTHEKATYVRQMFSHIATTYDVANRAMTFGMDVWWRQLAVELVAPPYNGNALDVGSGTGDFIPLLTAWMPQGRVVGVDFCLPMMQEGASKLDNLCPESGPESGPESAEEGRKGCVASFIGGDALHLPFPDNSFDAITTGFTLRNVTDITATFREMHRVCKPQGMIACLEVAHPENPILQFGHRVYLDIVVPWIGERISGNRRAYVYLDQSARAFPSPRKIAAMMEESGWHNVHYRLLSLGAVAIHTGVKV
jgi:demethylmenaquinone methyltransferase/2-methoxy-6-polyprenyl-1,4-benzoquinol methylase